MLSIWNPYNDWGFGNIRRTLSAMDELRREMSSLLVEPSRRYESNFAENWQTWPNTCLRDEGEAFVVRAEVPGLSEKDIDVTVTGDTLSLHGERKADVPEGYTAHRKERSNFTFSRSFVLPTKVDAEKASATVKNGVLELTLPKAAEAQPRKIAVKAH